MSTPSEGPDRLHDTLTRAGFTEAQQTAVLELLELQRTTLEREAALQARSLGSRARQAAPYGVAGGAVAMTEPGQAAIGKVVDAGKWTGDQAVAAGQYIGREASEAYHATVEGAQQLGRDVGHAAAEGYRATVDGLQAAGQAVGHAAAEGYRASVDGLQAAGQAVGGFAVETWGRATEAAQAVGQWATQYADQVAANPSAHAVTAAVAAGAVVAATPQLRQAVAQAANATNRWAKARVSAVASATRSATQSMKKLYDAVRSDPRVDYALNRVGITPRQTHQATNEITAPEPTALPKAGDLQLTPPGQDQAMKPLTGIVVKAGEQPAAGAGEAANPQYKGGNKSLDRGQGQDGR